MFSSLSLDFSISFKTLLFWGGIWRKIKMAQKIFLMEKVFFLVGEKVFHDRQKSVFIVNIEERV
jgi:hypothetical protein